MATRKEDSVSKTKTQEATSHDPRGGVGRAPNRGLLRAVQPSAALAAVVGDEALPRTEITRRLWEYIKAHGLQDKQNKRLINADSKLRQVFGGKDQVSMFELAKLVSQQVR
jgi:upstream activation factor subunit UAF30